MGLLDGLLGGSDGTREMSQSVDEWRKLATPDIEQMKIQLEGLVQQGQMTPEEAQNVLLGQSDMNNISLDPKLKQTQMDALSSLMDISDSGGMTTMDKANLSKIQNQEMAAQRGQREAILQNAQARGMGGSGLEMMAQLQNQQDSATRQSQRDLDVAGMAQQRALDSLIQGGNMAGQIGAQDFGQQAQVAGANDAIARFNAQNQNANNQFNVSARNQAQAQNLAEKQRVADQNVNNRNQSQMNNKALIQQDFQNRATKAGGMSGSLANQAGMKQGQQQADTQFIGNLVGAGVSAYTAGANKKAKDGGLVGGPPTDYDSQEHTLQPGELIVKKEDVPDYLAKAHTDKDGKFDAAGFLDQITGYKYNYSGKGNK